MRSRLAWAALPAVLTLGCNRPAEIAAERPQPSAAQAPLQSPAPSPAPPVQPTAALGTGLCAADEPVVFSCTVRGGRIASVCGVLSKGARFAQYRFGARGAVPELVWPAAPADGSIRFASVPYSGGGEAQLMFDHAGVLYVAYSRVIRTRFDGQGNDPDFQDGVAVFRGGRLVSRLSCNDTPDPIAYDLGQSLATAADDIVDLTE